MWEGLSGRLSSGSTRNRTFEDSLGRYLSILSEFEFIGIDLLCMYNY